MNTLRELEIQEIDGQFSIPDGEVLSAEVFKREVKDPETNIVYVRQFVRVLLLQPEEDIDTESVTPSLTSLDPDVPGGFTPKPGTAPLPFDFR